MTFEVQQTRWDRIIRRVSGSIGPGSRVSETLSELFPVLDVERVPGELLILGGTNLCFGSGRITGAAGEVPFVQLENPADSGNIITISSLVAANDAVSVLRWGRTNTALGAAIGTETFRDSRRLVTARPVGRIRQGSQVAVVGGTGITRVINNDSYSNTDRNGIVVLAPGTLFEFGAETAASTLTLTLYWRERPAEESELQF